MPDRVLDFRLFRYALASAEHGSFRRAAAALNVQQSTVSRGVRSLEYRVGAELFERGHAGIRPTPAGDRFLEEATLGFDHLSRAMQRIGAAQRGEHGELTVAVSVPFILLGEMFKRFRGEYEGVSVEIVEGTSSANWGLIQQRKVDVAFVAKIGGHGVPRSLHLRDVHMIAVLPRSHPLATARKVALDELYKERFIFGSGGMGPDIEEQLLTRMARRGLEPRVQLHRVGQCNLINMVAMGFGVTIAVGTPPPAATDQVALVPLAGRNTLSLHAVWMESNPNPALTGLLDIVQRCSRPSGGM
jgi:DNA-binding transcriptional LysR family regulator